MTRFALDILCDPVDGGRLNLGDAVSDAKGNITSGRLISAAGREYPIVNGIPRFVKSSSQRDSVASFGREWNEFNFIDFEKNWEEHTVRNTFGGAEVFRGKIVVDAGGGSGAQTLWMLQRGARHVIMLELSNSVDDVVARNLSQWPRANVDVIQCSIDAPPLLPNSISGIVYCHNVIQHTPSVEKTARALYEIVGSGGELVFNCYPKNDTGVLRWMRFNLIRKPLRGVLSRMPFWVLFLYASFMAILRQIPIVGLLLEKSSFCLMGDVRGPENESAVGRMKRRMKATRLNTFDAYGSHHFQHHKSNAELWALLKELQPDETKVLNAERYFSRPPPIGIALRVLR